MPNNLSETRHEKANISSLRQQQQLGDNQNLERGPVILFSSSGSRRCQFAEICHPWQKQKNILIWQNVYGQRISSIRYKYHNASNILLATVEHFNVVEFIIRLVSPEVLCEEKKVVHVLLDLAGTLDPMQTKE